jgi:type II secretory pathway pseudopilin PulG
MAKAGTLQTTRPRQRRRSLCEQHGFTGIELLIVLATLGVLLATVAMSLDDIDQSARKREMALEQQAVQGAIDTYNMHDVKGRGVPTITPQDSPIALKGADGCGSPHFQRYLIHDTRFRYTWGAGGVGLRVAD